MLRDILSENRETVLQSWFNLIIETYPEDGRKFFRGGKDRFANPVGTTIRAAMEEIFDNVVESAEPEKSLKSLDSIIRIRSVQEFRPSEAVSFVLKLKQLIRNCAAEKSPGSDCETQLSKMDSYIDNLTLLAFDIYSQNRERMHEARVNEIKRRSGKLFERLNWSIDAPADGEENTDK